MLGYLLELRQRALRILLAFISCFLVFFYYATPLYRLLVKPLLQALPAHSALIATTITASVVTPIHVAANLAVFATTPVALFQLWQFMAPALYRHEQRQMCQLIITSFLLFCLGMLFCFYIILPFMFQFFIQALPVGVQLMPDMTSALTFTTHMLLIFGLCFQVPLLCVLLTRLQWLTVTTLRLYRPYMIVGAFIVGMLLTPPDVLSQIMLALPLCLLYELGIFFAVYST